MKNRVPAERATNEAPGSAQVLSSAELTRFAARAGRGHRIGNLPPDTRVLKGGFDISRAMSGVMVHTTDSVALAEATASIELPPGLVLSMVLEGGLEFAIDGTHRRVGPANGDRDAFAMNLVRPAVLERRLEQGRRVRKVNLSIPEGWLASRLDCRRPQDRAVSDLLCRHLEVPVWKAAAPLRALAEEVLRIGRQTGIAAGGPRPGDAGRVLRRAREATASRSGDGSAQHGHRLAPGSANAPVRGSPSARHVRRPVSAGAGHHGR